MAFEELSKNPPKEIFDKVKKIKLKDAIKNHQYKDAMYLISTDIDIAFIKDSDNLSAMDIACKQEATPENQRFIADVMIIAVKKFNYQEAIKLIDPQANIPFLRGHDGQSAIDIARAQAPTEENNKFKQTVLTLRKSALEQRISINKRKSEELENPSIDDSVFKVPAKKTKKSGAIPNHVAHFKADTNKVVIKKTQREVLTLKPVATQIEGRKF